jgi:hypothetical protein
VTQPGSGLYYAGRHTYSKRIADKAVNGYKKRKTPSGPKPKDALIRVYFTQKNDFVKKKIKLDRRCLNVILYLSLAEDSRCPGII